MSDVLYQVSIGENAGSHTREQEKTDSVTQLA